MSGGPKQTLQEGYEKFVIRNAEGCWDWSGCCSKNPGYGQFGYSMKKERAHRASWIIHYGDIPKGMYVMHKCDNKRCSRPDHLMLGTALENNRDMIKKGRHPTLGKTGPQNPNFKFSDEQINEVLHLVKSGIKRRDIASSYNMSRSFLSLLENNKIRRGVI